MECKSCYNCKNFKEENYIFVSCKINNDDNFELQLAESEDDERDINCPHWKDINS